MRVRVKIPVHAFGEAQGIGEPVGCGNPGAGDSIVETQYPDPAASEDVMHGGVIDRIRRLLRRKRHR